MGFRYFTSHRYLWNVARALIGRVPIVYLICYGNGKAKAGVYPTHCPIKFKNLIHVK